MGNMGMGFINGVMEFLKHAAINQPVYLLLVPLIPALWALERAIFSVSSIWVPLAFAVWATFQYGNYQRRVMAEDLNRRWRRAIIEATPNTPVEHCEWLNKLLMEIWPHYIHPKIASKLTYVVERRLKYRKPKLVERFELEDFSLGSLPPCLGLQGTRWSTLRGQRIMHASFEWETHEMSIMLLAKLSKPLCGTARIVINHLHIKGELQLMPVLDGRALLYSFFSTPEVKLGINFGGGGSQLPKTELPGVSSWLVKLFTETLLKTMVEPRRRCLDLPVVQLGKKAVGGILYVTVIRASQISKIGTKGSPSKKQQSQYLDENNPKELKRFVVAELDDLARRTDAVPGSSPQWNSTFNMILHDDAGLVRFILYESIPNSVKFDLLASCEIKIKYSDDDSTIFWAIGPDSGILVQRAECCGNEVVMNVPFEGLESGELMVKLVLKEWHFLDGSQSVGTNLDAQPGLCGSLNIELKTGRKIFVTVVEAKDLAGKDKSGKSDPYIKLQYGKVAQRTKAVPNSNHPVWNQILEFDEIGGCEQLKLKCLCEEKFGDDIIGSATVYLEGMTEGTVRDVLVPLEKVISGEVKLQICIKEGFSAASNGWVELVVVEARELPSPDLMGTRDPFVKILYGNEKRRTKVFCKTLNPLWNQTFEFLDNGSQLELQVRDYNAILSSSSIGYCIVEYQRLPPNEVSDKWIPLQGVKKGEIHVHVTRRIPNLQKKPGIASESILDRGKSISSQMKQMLMKLRSTYADDDYELSNTLCELQSLEDVQEEYLIQLETERILLLNRMNDLGQELLNPSTPHSWTSSST